MSNKEWFILIAFFIAIIIAILGKDEQQSESSPL